MGTASLGRGRRAHVVKPVDTAIQYVGNSRWRTEARVYLRVKSAKFSPSHLGDQADQTDGSTAGDTDSEVSLLCCFALVPELVHRFAAALPQGSTKLNFCRFALNSTSTGSKNHIAWLGPSERSYESFFRTLEWSKNPSTPPIVFPGWIWQLSVPARKENINHRGGSESGDLDVDLPDVHVADGISHE